MRKACGQHRPLLLMALLVGLCQTGQAQEAQRATPAAPPAVAVTLFQNVRIFDGKNGTLSPPRNVLVRQNRIERVTTDQITIDPTGRLVDGGGRTLMPGLIDMHWHTMMVRPTPVEMLSADIGYLHLVAGAEAGGTLMRGVTTLRGLGGPAVGAKRSIHQGAGVG